MCAIFWINYSPELPMDKGVKMICFPASKEQCQGNKLCRYKDTPILQLPFPVKDKKKVIRSIQAGLQKMLAVTEAVVLLWQLRFSSNIAANKLLVQQCSKNKCQTKGFRHSVCNWRTVLLITDLPIIALPMTRFRFLLLSLHHFDTVIFIHNKD